MSSRVNVAPPQMPPAQTTADETDGGLDQRVVGPRAGQSKAPEQNFSSAIIGIALVYTWAGLFGCHKRHLSDVYP